MSLAALPPALRVPVASTGRRLFSTSPTRPASPLFMLSALSNSRETQHFNKLSRLSRVEHSPSLKLIQTSEVDPYPLPTPPQPTGPPAVPANSRMHSRTSPARVWDKKALQAGRTILADGARRVLRLERALERAKRREVMRSTVLKDDRAMWQREAHNLRREVRTAGIFILLSVATATALASWRFWPRQAVSADPGRLGERLAETAAIAMPLPALSQISTLSTITGSSNVGMQQQRVPVSSTAPISASISTAEVKPSSWKSLLWKQD